MIVLDNRISFICQLKDGGGRHDARAVGSRKTKTVLLGHRNAKYIQSARITKLAVGALQLTVRESVVTS